MQNIELHPIDRARWLQQTSEAIFVLHHAPTVLVQIDDDDTDTGFGPGIVAVEAVTCQPFTIELELEDPRFSRARVLKVRAAREQVPLTIATASTLYTLQGATTTPGMIYHFRTPRRINSVTEAAALNWLDNSDPRHHRQRPSRRIPDQVLEYIWRKDRSDTDGG